MTTEPTAMLTLTGKRLNELRNVLTNLANRSLPDADAESIVVSMLHLLKPATDRYDAHFARIKKDGDAVSAMDEGAEKMAAFKDIQKRVERLEEDTHEVPAPKTKLSPKHLPKDKKGVDGNGVAVAAIRFALMPELMDEPAPTEPSE
jgi:hypothetical protein